MINLRLRIISMPDIDAWAGAVRDGAQRAAPAVAEVLREHADSCFENSRDPWGAAWPVLSDATLAERERLGKTGKILIRDGTLRLSVFGSPTTPTEGVFDAECGAGGAAAAYAMRQQFGDEGGPLPARAFLPVRPDGSVELPADLDAEVEGTIVDALDMAFAAAMRRNITPTE